jgi:hypothetical protein
MSFEQVAIEENWKFIKLYNLQDGSFTEHRLKHPPNWMNHVGNFISINGTKLLQLLGNFSMGEIQIYDINTMDMIKSFFVDRTVYQRTRCIFGEDEFILYDSDSFVKYTMDGEQLEKHDTPSYPRFSLDLQFVAYHSGRNELKILKIDDFCVCYTFQLKPYECIGEFFTSCSSYFVYGTVSEIFVFDVKSGELHDSFKIENVDSLYRGEGSIIIYTVFETKTVVKVNFYNVENRCLQKKLTLITHRPIHYIKPTMLRNEFYVMLYNDLCYTAYLHVEKGEYLDCEKKCSIASTNLIFGLKRKMGSYTKAALR